MAVLRTRLPALGIAARSTVDKYRHIVMLTIDFTLHQSKSTYLRYLVYTYLLASLSYANKGRLPASGMSINAISEIQKGTKRKTNLSQGKYDKILTL
jgi:hypothetical protein